MSGLRKCPDESEAICVAKMSIKHLIRLVAKPLIKVSYWIENQPTKGSIKREVISTKSYPDGLS